MAGTKKYKFFLGTGFAGAEYEDEVEFPATMTEQEIEAEFKTWVWERLDP